MILLLLLLWLLMLLLMPHSIDLLLIAAIEEVLHFNRTRDTDVATVKAATTAVDAAADAVSAVVGAFTVATSACAVARDLDHRRGAFQSACFQGVCDCRLLQSRSCSPPRESRLGRELCKSFVHCRSEASLLKQLQPPNLNSPLNVNEATKERHTRYYASSGAIVFSVIRLGCHLQKSTSYF